MVELSAKDQLEALTGVEWERHRSKAGVLSYSFHELNTEERDRWRNALNERTNGDFFGVSNGMLRISENSLEVSEADVPKLPTNANLQELFGSIIIEKKEIRDNLDSWADTLREKTRIDAWKINANGNNPHFSLGTNTPEEAQQFVESMNTILGEEYFSAGEGKIQGNIKITVEKLRQLELHTYKEDVTTLRDALADIDTSVHGTTPVPVTEVEPQEKQALAQAKTKLEEDLDKLMQRVLEQVTGEKGWALGSDGQYAAFTFKEDSPRLIDGVNRKINDWTGVENCFKENGGRLSIAPADAKILTSEINKKDIDHLRQQFDARDRYNAKPAPEQDEANMKSGKHNIIGAIEERSFGEKLVDRTADVLVVGLTTGGIVFVAGAVAAGVALTPWIGVGVWMAGAMLSQQQHQTEGISSTRVAESDSKLVGFVHRAKDTLAWKAIANAPENAVKTVGNLIDSTFRYVGQGGGLAIMAAALTLPTMGLGWLAIGTAVALAGYVWKNEREGKDKKYNSGKWEKRVQNERISARRGEEDGLPLDDGEAPSRA